MLWPRDIYRDLQRLKKRVKKSFDAFKEEMDDHRKSINQNTDEIQAVYDYLSNLETKLDKLSERMDRFEMMARPDVKANDMELSREDQKVFTVLYTSDKKVSTNYIAKRLRMDENDVRNCIYNLKAKGIPLLRESVNGKLNVALESRFKDIQAKNNVLNIDESVVKDVMKQ